MWNGLVSDLLEERADMVVTSLKVNPERNDVIAFSIPFMSTGISILVGIRSGIVSPTAFLGQ